MADGKIYRTHLSRDEIDAINRPTFDLIEIVTRECFKKSGLCKDTLDDIILTGGSTKMLEIINRMEDIFGLEIKTHHNGEFSVIGAAYAGKHPSIINSHHC